MRFLDTDVLVDVGRGHLPAVTWLLSLSEPPQMPGFVQMELVEGCRDKAELRRIQAIVAPYQLVWPTEDDCRRALADFTQFHLSHSLGMQALRRCAEPNDRAAVCPLLTPPPAATLAVRGYDKTAWKQRTNEWPLL